MIKDPTTKRFRQVYIEITNRCNLTCSFCPRTGRPLADMEPALFARIAEEVKPLTEQVYLHVMGEPLMHPNFSDLIQICAYKALPVAITTNGSMLNTDSAKSLLVPIVRRINISLDALGTGDKDKFDQIIAFTRLAFEQRPDLYINYRLWNLAFSSEGLDSESNRLICRRIEDAFGITIPPQGHSSGRKSLHMLNRLYLHLDTRFNWPGEVESGIQNTNGFCHALSSHFAILVDGTVVPCCLDHNGVTALGNCREQSLNSILESPRATAMVKGFSEGRLIEPLCQQCTFISRFASRAKRTKEHRTIIS
ncbi:MAG: SPASM domain-containing protein [Deltaproteobacteria bacterium]|nr:SPASM domain-containing protein [Deltaproteobacteria bacterium]